MVNSPPHYNQAGYASKLFVPRTKATSITCKATQSSTVAISLQEWCRGLEKGQWYLDKLIERETVDNMLPTPYQQFIHKSRYARWLDDEQRRENWSETVELITVHGRSRKR